MPTTWLTSDTHFGHQLMVRNGNRPWDNIEDMNEALVKNWNDTVGPNDLVYHLGDVVMNRRFLPIVSRLNGRKKLIKGNHDFWRLEELTPYFVDILSCAVFQDAILTHIPVHVDQLQRFKVNIHGHTHKNNVTKVVHHSDFSQYGRGNWTERVPDPRYICVCVEQTEYKPVMYEELRKRFP